MNRLLRWFVGLSLVFSLVGCIGEDFDVGAPSARLAVIGTSTVSLTKANINWSSSIGDEQQTVDDIQAFGLSQDQAVMIS